MPSPESPAKRITTLSRLSTGLILIPCVPTRLLELSPGRPCGVKTRYILVVARMLLPDRFELYLPLSETDQAADLADRREPVSHRRWCRRCRRTPLCCRHGGPSTGGTTSADGHEAHDLRVRCRPRGGGLGADQCALLPLCVSLRDLRRRRRLPLPMGHRDPQRRPRHGVAGRDGHLHRCGPRWFGPCGATRPVAVALMPVDLPMPRIGAVNDDAPRPIKLVLNWGRRYSLWVFNFGLACCAIEFISASMARHDFIRLGVIPFAPGPRQADLMIVSGTVTDKMAPAIRRLYDQMPEPKYVISFGACANSGGPYWDSYCVTKGVDQLIPVDVYVPGCPPRPEALLQGIIRLQEKIASETLSNKAIRAKYAGSRRAAAGEVTRPLLSKTEVTGRDTAGVPS